MLGPRKNERNSRPRLIRVRAFPMSYHELNIGERVTIQLGLHQNQSQREIGRLINRVLSAVNREVRHNRDAAGAYTVRPAQHQRW